MLGLKFDEPSLIVAIHVQAPAYAEYHRAARVMGCRTVELVREAIGAGLKTTQLGCPMGMPLICKLDSHG